jgi:hypothetical protein
MTIVRLAVWLSSAGWLSYSASTIPDGNALGTPISVCCFVKGVVIDGLLTTDDASPAGDPTPPMTPPITSSVKNYGLRRGLSAPAQASSWSDITVAASSWIATTGRNVEKFSKSVNIEKDSCWRTCAI